MSKRQLQITFSVTMTRLTEVCHKFKKTQIKKFTNYRGPTPLLKWVRPAELKDEVSVRKKIKGELGDNRVMFLHRSSRDVTFVEFMAV